MKTFMAVLTLAFLFSAVGHADTATCFNDNGKTLVVLGMRNSSVVSVRVTMNGVNANNMFDTHKKYTSVADFLSQAGQLGDGYDNQYLSLKKIEGNVYEVTLGADAWLERAFVSCTYQK